MLSIKCLFRSARPSSSSIFVGLVFAGSASAQDLPISFSIDWHGPTISATSPAGGAALTEADILAPASGVPTFGPLDNPVTRITGGELGLSRYTMCLGHQPGTPCGIEVDAFSYGRAARILNDSDFRYRLFFTVDEYAIGGQGVLPPSIQTEGPAGDIGADILIGEQLPPGPVPPGPGLHAILYDGNGLTSATGFAKFGLGLEEPNVPDSGLPGASSDFGDNIDAISIGHEPVLDDLVLFSVDAGFLDPRVMLPNSGTAGFEGVSGADILVHRIGMQGYVNYASADQLGLDLQGAGTDDLDALTVAENGIPGFQPSQQPYDWVSGLGPGMISDMVLFSVRRGSDVIGEIDSIQGLEIQEGDILTTPLPMALGGLSPNPGIFIAAEALGMAVCRGGGGPADDANGLSVDDLVPIGNDCNSNGREDSVDIACGGSLDVNMNGIPDECELLGTAACTCDGLGPCGNDAATTGCLTSAGTGAFIDMTAGSTSVFADDLVLTAFDVPANRPGLFFMGGSLVNLPFGDGRRCVGAGGVGVRRFPVQNSGPSGTFVLGDELADFTCTQFPPPGCIDSGDTFHFQAWFRDPPGPCGSGFNLSGSWSVTFTP